MKWILRVIDYIEEGIIFLGLLAMALLNFANIVSRYCLHKSLSYTEEVVIIIFVWVTMMGISEGYKRHAHLGMSFLTDRLPKPGKGLAILFSGICSFILIFFIVFYGWQMVQNQMRLGSMTTALRLPTWVQGLAIPAGGVLMAIRTVQAVAQQLSGLHGDGKEKES